MERKTSTVHGKILSLIAFSAMGLFGQTARVSGIVKDAVSGAVIKDAIVVLFKARLADTTDPAGAFSFDYTAPPVTSRELHPPFRQSPVLSGEGVLHFELEATEVVSLTIRATNGKAIHRFRKKLGIGGHAIPLPGMGHGVHLYTLSIGGFCYTLKHANLSGPMRGTLAFSQASGPAERSLGKASAAAVDTLHVYFKGYTPVFLPITALVSTGLEIKLAKPAFDIWQALPDPDTKPVATGKPLKVFLQMGQSNMIGYGQIAPDTVKGTLSYVLKDGRNYSHIVDDAGAWTVRNDVWDVNVVSAQKKGWHTVGFGNGADKIGPEFQFGHIMGHIHDEMVLLVKASRGNRGLGWDILPPGSARYDYGGYTYAGSNDSLERWPADSGYDWARTHCAKPNPETGNCFVSWYAGKEYDLWVSETHKVLDNLAANFPGYNAADGYEIAGLTWFQGHRDAGDMGKAVRYELNMVHLIKALRKEFKAPNMKVVIATIAFDGWDKMDNTRRVVAQAQLNAGDAALHPEFADNVRTVETRDYFQPQRVSPGTQDFHYFWNAEFYYSVGNAMGWAMKDLLGK